MDVQRAFGRSWEARLGGIDLPVIGEVDPAAAFYTPFRPGQIITLPRVAGHRQACTTDCPGNVLFAHLERVRRGVVRLAGSRPATLTLAVTGEGSFGPTYLSLGGSAALAGAPQALAGRLADAAGAPLAGATIELQEILAHGATRTLQQLTTDADGAFVGELTLSASTLLRALHRSAPAVSVQNATFTVRLRRPRPGSYVVLARTAPSVSNAAGESAPLYLTVT
jgi:hypothetical protein